jgi:hypothetical protein
MSDTHNLSVWNAVNKTDPAHTKAVTFGRRFTSIDAHWQIMRATEQFGPVGQGWGYFVQHSVERLTPEMILAVADVTVWWRDGDRRHEYGPVRGMCEIYGPKTDKGKPIPGLFVTDEDAPKKAMTDALTKGLSHLGFSADVFLGLFDDNRYVQKVKKEFEQTSVPMGSHPGSFADEARADGLTTETRSTYQVQKDRKAVATLEQAARLAISMCSDRTTLSTWWNENKGELTDKLPEDSFLTIKSEVIARRDQLPALAA